MKSPDQGDGKPQRFPRSGLVRHILTGILLLLVAWLTYRTHELQEFLRLAEGGIHADNGMSNCQQFKPSALAKKYLDNLHGIEIGASTQNSFRLKRSINVDFSDEQGGLWQSESCPPAVVNLVAPGDNLPFKSDTLDYVLSSHVIEHFFDPIKALREWHRVIKPGGYLFIVVPHKDRTFDNHREITPVEELVDRSTGRISISNYAWPYDKSAAESTGKKKFGSSYQLMPQLLVRDKAGTRLDKGWKYYETDDHHHWSVWRTADFVELVKRLDFTIVEIQDRDDKTLNGFTVVIRK